MGFIAPLYQLQSIYILPKSLVFVKLFLIRLATIDFFCAMQTCMTSKNHCNCFRCVAQGNCLWGQAHWVTLISRKLCLWCCTSGYAMYLEFNAAWKQSKAVIEYLLTQLFNANLEKCEDSLHCNQYLDYLESKSSLTVPLE